MKNQLYFGDCLDVLKELYAAHPNGFIDLIYIDPPFNSKRNYNILFEDVEMKDTKAQKEAFADTWSSVSYKDTIHEIQDLDLDLYKFLEALDNIRVSKSAISYLTTMAIRIWYMHKVLKDTGSFYLHCDPTMSHYLKLLCDLIFDESNFRNEIIWKRTNSKGLAFTRFASNHDVIFYYSKGKNFVWNSQYTLHDPEYIRKFYRYVEPTTGRRYQLDNLTNPNKDRPNLTYEFLGVKRVWRWTKERMEEAYKEGLVIQSGPGVVPRLKRYLDEQEGTPIGDTWFDVYPIQSKTNEALGYPTQKPIDLLERIIQASTNKGDLVADFFCGCGTTVSAAQKLNRHWIGSDISHLAIGLIEKRLRDTYGPKIKETYEVHGLPKDIASAKQLATGEKKGRMEFQDWVIETLLGGVSNPKKTADGGWDGHMTFEMPGAKKETVLIEVKSGNVNVKNIREFCNVVEKQKAAIGIFVCFEEQVTKPMQLDARNAGYYDEKNWQTRYPRVQILTVEDLMDGTSPAIPTSYRETFKSAKRQLQDNSRQESLF